MYCKLALATLAVIIGSDLATAKYIPPTTTAAELWNPWTWFWPYAQALSESNRDYFLKSQEATNELYLQVYKTNAFPWVTGNWELPMIGQTPSPDNENSENETSQDDTEEAQD